MMLPNVSPWYTSDIDFRKVSIIIIIPSLFVIALLNNDIQDILTCVKQIWFCCELFFELFVRLSFLLRFFEAALSFCLAFFQYSFLKDTLKTSFCPFSTNRISFKNEFIQIFIFFYKQPMRRCTTIEFSFFYLNESDKDIMFHTFHDPF